MDAVPRPIKLVFLMSFIFQACKYSSSEDFKNRDLIPNIYNWIKDSKNMFDSTYVLNQCELESYGVYEKTINYDSTINHLVDSFKLKNSLNEFEPTNFRNRISQRRVVENDSVMVTFYHFDDSVYLNVTNKSQLIPGTHKCGKEMFFIHGVEKVGL